MVALSPIFILSLAILILCILLFCFKISNKICGLFTVIALSIVLLFSLYLVYQLSVYSQPITDIRSNNMQVPSTKSSANQVSTKSINETIRMQVLPAFLSNKNKQITKNDIDIQTENNTSNKSITQENSKVDNVPANEQFNHNKAHENANGTNEQTDSTWAAGYVTALFTCDGYGLLYTCLFLVIAIIVVCFAMRWFQEDDKRLGIFYLLLLILILGGIILTYATHLIAFFMGFELLTIPFVGLIGYQYQQSHTLEAAIKYMVLSSVVTSFLLMGIAFYYSATGELTFTGLSFQLSTLTYQSTLLLMGVCLMIIGIGFKLSLVPFQLWLPDVYQGAPTVVSLLLSTVVKVAIFCSLARLFLLAPIVNNDTIRIILIVMAFFSILWGNLFALIQTNIKRLLAYSSITHFGYLFIALIAVQYQVLALETIGVYLISYVLANICILGVISVESHCNELQDHENELDLKGLFWRRPFMALAMGVGLLSLAGVPLTAGFIGRFLLILLGVTADLWWLIVALIIGSAIGLYFYIRLIIILYIKPADYAKQSKIAGFNRIKLSEIHLNEIIIILSALLIIICGIYPKGLFNLVNLAQYFAN